MAAVLKTLLGDPPPLLEPLEGDAGEGAVHPSVAESIWCSTRELAAVGWRSCQLAMETWATARQLQGLPRDYQSFEVQYVTW